MTKDESEWIVEEFYFGSAAWPSYATWRHRGDEYQNRVEWQLGLNLSREQIEAIAQIYECVDQHSVFVGDTEFICAWVASTETAYLRDFNDAWI